jgi:L-alanine-DL-glutamate epimerase-like enolase superfamily enzyme
MKIKSVKATFHDLIVPVPLFEKPIIRRQVVFCEVETDNGLVGHGLTGGQYLPYGVVPAIERHVGQTVMDMDPRDTEAIHEKVWWAHNQRSMTGVVSAALSAIDIACWDIHGKHTGRTVAQLLGGHRDWADAYVTFGFAQYDREQIVEAAKIQIAKGVARLKMVVGVDKGGWREDAWRVRAVRDAVGEDVDMMIDANYKFAPVEAKLLCRAIEDCNLTWLEEPMYANDVRAMADLRNSTCIPLAAGQMEGHRWRFRELVERHAVDFIQPNVCYNGGYTESQKVAHMAQTFNVMVTNGGGWPLHNMHVIAGMMNGYWVEYHLGMQETGERLYINPPSPIDNRVHIPDAPGLGLTPNWDSLNDSQVKDPE